MILNVGWFAENHVAANLLMLFLLLAGALTGLTMKLEVFPEASLDRVNISMAYSGASPAEFIGVRKGEIHIEISESNLCQYGLTLGDVADSVRKASLDLEKRYLPELSALYPGLQYSMEGEGKEQKESLEDVYKGFAVALFCIYALLAIPFKSFTQPFIIMAAIPFAFVGAVAGHLLMGLNRSLLSLFGMVGLTGVVVNDSLVLIHASNRALRKWINGFKRCGVDMFEKMKKNY